MASTADQWADGLMLGIQVMIVRPRRIPLTRDQFAFHNLLDQLESRFPIGRELDTARADQFKDRLGYDADQAGCSG